MNPHTKKVITNEIDKLLQRSKISQNELAKKIGLSAAQLINMRTDANHHLVSNKLWNKAALYFSINDWQLIETSNLLQIKSVLADAHKHQRFMAIIGNSGAGKTQSLKEYANNNSNTYVMLADALQKSKEFFKFIAIAMGLTIEGNARAILQAIIEKVDALENPLIIIDDAGKLNDGNYRNLQLLYDSTEGKCGIAIAGTPYLKHYIDKMAGKGKMGFDELKRRIEYWLTLDRPLKTEVETICTLNEITDKDCINYLFNKASNFGVIRTTIVTAKRIKTAREIEIDVELLETILP